MSGPAGPELIMANDGMYQTISNDPERDRMAVLVNLATYED